MLITHEIIRPKNIKDQLLKDGLDLLSTESGSDSPDWRKITQENSSNNELQEFIKRHKESSESTTVTRKNLKQTCSKVMKLLNIDPDLKDAKKFCTRPKN